MPAKSHPEVIVQAVSARDRKKAEVFAKSHGIPEVKDSYDGELSSTAQSHPPMANLTRYPERPEHRLCVHTTSKCPPL